jgi:tetratricopeptide (TPR) repeat protein
MLDEARFLKNQLGNAKKAIKLCDEILKIEPENRDAMLIKAGGLNELGKAEEFARLTKSIVQRWPDHWEAYYLMSMPLFALNEDEAALKLMEKSLELDENFNNVSSYAQMLYLIGRSDYIEYVEKMKKLDAARADNFMKNVWVWDMDGVKPTRSEAKQAKKTIEGWKKMKKD